MSKLSISSLKMSTGVSDDQLDMKITGLTNLAECFDNYADYLEYLEITSHEEEDIKLEAFLHGSKQAMQKALKCWRNRYGYNAKYKYLVEICLELKKGEVAQEIFKHILSKNSRK